MSHSTLRIFPSKILSFHLSILLGFFFLFWKIVYLCDKTKNVTNKEFKPMLGAYPDFSNICLKYQPRYQK